MVSPVVSVEVWRCGGLVVSVPASRPNLDPGGGGPPHSAVWGVADHTVKLNK